MSKTLFFRKKKTNNDNYEEQSADHIDIRTVGKAKSWVASLPVADMGETTRNLFAGITQLNKDPIPPSDRIEVTEVLLPYVKIVVENLDRHFFIQSLPLPERSRKIFDLKQSLLMEIAGSYQLAALEMLTKKSTGNKKVLLSIGRAISIMTQVLMNGFEIYAKAKKSLWHDVHHLYLLACENNLERKSIPDNAGFQSDFSTIEEHYKLINLIALCAPNTLRQGESTRVKDFFKETITDAKIVDNVDHVKSKYAHIALMNSDEPASLMPISDMVNSPTSRIFDLSKVISMLDQFVNLSDESDLGMHETRPMLTHSLAKRMVYILTTIRNRRYKRFARDEKSSLIIRMTDVVEMIRDNEVDAFDAELNQDVEDDNIYEALASEDQVSSPWTEIDIDELAEEKDIQVHSWKISNSSSGGYGLRQIKNESTPARVGELVGIKDPKDETSSWQVAAIRWIDSFHDIGLTMGLEILSPKATTVTVEEVFNREIAQKLPLEGILLPKVDGAREKENLIFPGYIFHIDDELSITINSKPQKIRITSVDDTVGSFSYCSYETFEPEVKDEDSIESFDDVWEFL